MLGNPLQFICTKNKFKIFAFFSFLLVVAPYDRVMVVNSDYLNERSHERVTTEGYRGYS